jgi:hypothetical protein
MKHRREGGVELKPISTPLSELGNEVLEESKATYALSCPHAVSGHPENGFPARPLAPARPNITSSFTGRSGGGWPTKAFGNDFPFLRWLLETRAKSIATKTPRHKVNKIHFFFFVSSRLSGKMLGFRLSF